MEKDPDILEKIKAIVKSSSASTDEKRVLAIHLDRLDEMFSGKEREAVSRYVFEKTFAEQRIKHLEEKVKDLETRIIMEKMKNEEDKEDG